MKLKFLYLFILLILFKESYSQDETSSSLSSGNDNSYCIGKTAKECMSANACCVWCEGLLPSNSTIESPTPTTVPEPSGYCHYAEEITECPKEMKFAVCLNYNITQCSCNIRNSATSIYNSSHSRVSLIIITIIFSIISLL